MKSKIVCPNKRDPAWKILVRAVGKNRAYCAFFRNGNVIPDAMTAQALLGLKESVKRANTRRTREREPSTVKRAEMTNLFTLGAGGAIAR